MSTLLAEDNAHASVKALGQTAKYWEARARRAEEERNHLLSDHARLKEEFDDITANAEWLASIIRSHLMHLPEAREALDASPGASLERLKWQLQSRTGGDS